MLRVIFDTNIYGKLVEENNFRSVATQIAEDKDFKIYGFQADKKRVARHA